MLEEVRGAYFALLDSDRIERPLSSEYDEKIRGAGTFVEKPGQEANFEVFRSSEGYGPHGKGIRTAQIFGECGFDWGDYPKAKSTAQRYWVVAAIRELEAEGLVERVSESGPWRLR